MPPRPDRRVPVIRRMRYHPSSSYALCEDEGYMLVERAKPGTASRVARDHTRSTGHPTRAGHLQEVSYRKDGNG
jgi:hypothetical protein